MIETVVLLRRNYDRNSQLTVEDVLLLLLHARAIPGKTALDYDGDGGPTRADAISLLSDILQSLATRLVEIDRDNGVKVNYGKIEDTLRKVVGLAEERVKVVKMDS